MGRSRFGAILLAALLLLGIVCQQVQTRQQRPIHHALEATAQAARREDWAAAEDHLGTARKTWGDYRDLGAIFSHQAPLEAVDAQFAALEILCAGRDPFATAAAAAQLAQQVKALEESQRLSWKNLL